MRGWAIGVLLPATIAIERYNQRVGSLERVELESEFGIVRVPDNPQWLGFRDVMRVNGKAVERRDERLAGLFENLTVSAIEQAGQISAESARFNIGPLRRSINDPALVLELLDWRNARRMLDCPFPGDGASHHRAHGVARRCPVQRPSLD
jgi:hypothetical protein